MSLLASVLSLFDLACVLHVSLADVDMEWASTMSDIFVGGCIVAFVPLSLSVVQPFSVHLG